MIGVRLGLFNQTTSAAFPAGTVWGVDFVNNRAEVGGIPVALDSLVSVARSSTSLHEWLNGDYEIFAPNVLRRTNKGALNEPAYTQYANNNFEHSNVVDGALGAGGSLPDHIAYDNNDGVYTYTVAALTKFGLPFISLRVQGTNSGGGTHFPSLSFAETANGTAAQGQDWVAHVRARMASGSAPAGGGIYFSGIRERNSENLYLNEQSAAIGGSAFNDYAIVKTLSDAGVSNIQSTIYMRIPSGATIDATIEVGMWELYKSNTLPQAPVINTGNTPVTQPADGLTLHLPSGTLDLTVAFDDGSEQIIGSVAGGDYLLLTLDRPIVSSITGIPA